MKSMCDKWHCWTSPVTIDHSCLNVKWAVLFLICSHRRGLTVAPACAGTVHANWYCMWATRKKKTTHQQYRCMYVWWKITFCLSNCAYQIDAEGGATQRTTEEYCSQWADKPVHHGPVAASARAPAKRCPPRIRAEVCLHTHPQLHASLPHQVRDTRRHWTFLTIFTLFWLSFFY